MASHPKTQKPRLSIREMATELRGRIDIETDPEVKEKLVKKLRNIGQQPMPDWMKGPSKGKNGNGRPRTGNKAVNLNHNATEVGSSHAHLDHAYNRFLEGLDQDEFRMALAAEKNKKFQSVLFWIGHPSTEKWSLTALLKRAGITLPEAMDLYGRYRTACAVRVAMDRTPKIMADTADDAENKLVACPRCDGFGTLDLDDVKEGRSSVRTCPECEGSGKVKQSGDNDSRKIIFEVAGLMNKKGPMIDARAINFLGAGRFSVENSVKEIEGWDDQKQISAGAENSDIIDAESEDK
jgi:hypothetical protein